MPEAGSIPGGDQLAFDVAVLLKGYPRLSETFIARELLGLQRRGLRFLIVSLRRPTDRLRHDLHEQVEAPVLYLPEYLHEEPRRVLRGWRKASRRTGFVTALQTWLRDFRRDPSRSRIRRFGQALVLAAELPAGIGQLHAHFIHTPGSVARYAALLLALRYSLSAHAKDVWTIGDWEKREKLEDCAWAVTCTAANERHLRELAPQANIELVYHGIDLQRFRPRARSVQAVACPLILSVARCVPKKGLDLLLDALAMLPPDLAWRFAHIGGGPLEKPLRAQAAALAIADRVTWSGSTTQLAVVDAMAGADLFCLPSRIAADGDRDGLPNVLLEAMGMGLAVVTTTVSAIPELVEHGRNGLLVPPDNAVALAAALQQLLTHADLRQRLGTAAHETVTQRFGETAHLDRLARRFGLPTARPEAV